MGMVVQHNISAQNANEAMRKNVSGLKKSTEKLSTGYSINRAADNAAGLAISEKMRSQIRGLTQATANSNDAISLIQTAEGGLQETEDIMQRMRELAVQSANGTYTDEDREQIQYEVDALKAEVDRISQATEYNEMKLLDGSLGGATGNNTEYGAKYGYVDQDLFNTDITTTSSIAGVKINFTTGASGVGGENAVWNAQGKELTINLDKTKSYTDNEINDLIKGAVQQKDDQQSNPIPDLTYKSKAGVISGSAVSSATTKNTTATVAGVRSTGSMSTAKYMQDGAADGKYIENMADTIKFTANTYGDTASTEGTFAKIGIATDVAAGKESVEVYKDRIYPGGDDDAAAEEVVLHLATGVEYSEQDIEKILAKAGYDYDVSLTDEDADPDGDKVFYANQKVKADDVGTKGTGVNVGDYGVAVAGGTGVGKGAVGGTGEGLTFQIGANGVEDQRLTVNVDDMSARALGIAGLSVAKQDDANDAINKIDDAIKTVSTQR
ncbi:MAG: flagellar hook protein, partial [Oribacterium sp.]|nr:flagellar hook protein [Oribacterium sp.]